MLPKLSISKSSPVISAALCVAAVAVCRGANGRCKFGFIDRAGRLVVAPQFDSYGYFRNGLARQTTRPYSPDATGQWGYVGRTGRFVWDSAD